MKHLLNLIDTQWGVVPMCSNCSANNSCKYACGHCYNTFYCSSSCQRDHIKDHLLIGNKNKGTKREREEEEELIEIDLRDIPPEIWDRINQFLSLEDLKNLSVVTKELLRNVRATMFRKYLFRVHDSLENFRKTSFADIVLNVRLTRGEQVAELQESDVFREIVTPWDFDEPLDNIKWPRNLRILHFGGNFDHPVDRLPKTLKKLIIPRSWFNQPVDNLPWGLERLSISSNRFNQPLDNLPPALQQLMLISNVFDQTLDNLPSSITHLDIWLPSLTRLDRFPQSLTRLYLRLGHFPMRIGQLPPSITHLELINLHDIVNAPPFLTHLTLGMNFEGRIQNLPQTLRYLKVYMPFMSAIQDLPTSVREIRIFDVSHLRGLPEWAFKFVKYIHSP